MLAKHIYIWMAHKDYEHLKSLVPLHVLRTKSDYSKASAALDTIIDEIGEDEQHPLADFAEALSVFIAAYEDEHYPIPDTSGVDVLTFLMGEHNLTQSDLPEIGSQGVVSEVLAGKRELNLRQVRSLAKRFKLSPAVFL